jgi:maleylacetate reductase
MRALAEGISVIAHDPKDIPARESAQLGAYLASVAYASAGTALHHKICHVLGGTFGLAHAQTHAVVLPHVAAFNLPSATDAARRIRQALGSDDALGGLEQLYRAVRAPRALAELGFSESDIPRAVGLILPAVPASNPRRVDAGALTRLLEAAWRGDAPGA